MDTEDAGASRFVVEPLEPRTLLAGTQYTLTVDLFHDRNDNGLRNSNDPSLMGWKVHLVYSSVPDIPGGGNGQRSLAATTDESGRAKFTFESSNTYGPQPRVRVLSPNRRWWNGRVDDRYDLETRTYSYLFKASDIGKVFGSIRGAYPSASPGSGFATAPVGGRTVFEDANRNGKREPDEKAVTADAHGNFRIVLRGGRRTLRLDPGPGWTAPPGYKLVREIDALQNLTISPFRTTPADPMVIDVLAAYSGGAAAVGGAGTSGNSNESFESHISDAFDTVNGMLGQSDTNVFLRLSKTMYTQYRESTIETDLLRLQRRNDGKLDDVLAERERIKADLVVLFTRAQPGEDKVGLAYQFLHHPDQDARGLSVIRVSERGAAAYVVAHEIGHNLGAGHHASTVAANHETLTAPYAQGYTFSDGYGNSRSDIMTYGNYAFPYFSTPRLKYDRKPMGDAETADNSRIIREIAPLVAAYR